MLQWVVSIVLLLLLGGSCGCPTSCQCDEGDVSCVGDGRLRFPGTLPDRLVRLELRNYAVPELLRTDLFHLPALEELHLQQCGLTSVEAGAFSHTPRLVKLDLSRNSLTSVNGSSFSSLGGLRYLDLSSNGMGSSDDEAFALLENLEQLDLRNNHLSRLTLHTFAGLHKVQYLNLDSNNISSVEAGTFQYLTHLSRLVISNNPLAALSRLDFFGSRLQYIDASQAGLARVPQTLSRFVRDLRLSGNSLSRIGAGDLDSYPYLGLLVLDDNCIGDIENDALGRLEYLVRLWLNGNCLTRVPPNLPPSLTSLYLEENRLPLLPDHAFRGMYRLEQLFLQRNEISEVRACAFCDLVSLRSLDLQANRIEELPAGAFDNLTSLENLDLSQNGLKRLDGFCFRGLARLATLQMSRVHTGVETDETVFDPLRNLEILEVYDSPVWVQTILNSTRMMHGMRHIREINLMHNYIERLRPDFPSFFPSLKVLKLGGNLWKCDRGIQWLSNWMRQSNVQFYSSYSIRCASPASLQLKPLMMLTEKDLAGDQTPFNHVLTEAPLQPNISETTGFVPSLELNHTRDGVKVPRPATWVASTSATTLDEELRDISPDAYYTSSVSLEGHARHPSPLPPVVKASGRVSAPGLSNVTSSASLHSSEQSRWAWGYLGLVVITLSVGLLALRWPRKHQRSSISYYPQSDEVSIVTLAEGKLYCIEGKKAADPQLQELLPTDRLY